MNMQSARPGMRRDAAWTIISVALLLCPAVALAQSSKGSFTAGSMTNRPAPKPVCVYKGVMSDAEIEQCTGFRVRYDYRVR